jgi:hypothetical protein
VQPADNYYHGAGGTFTVDANDHIEPGTWEGYDIENADLWRNIEVGLDTGNDVGNKALAAYHMGDSFGGANSYGSSGSSIGDVDLNPDENGNYGYTV